MSAGWSSGIFLLGSGIKRGITKPWTKGEAYDWQWSFGTHIDMYELCQSTSPPFPLSVDVGRDRWLSYVFSDSSNEEVVLNMCPTCIAGSIPLNHLDLKCPKISPAPSNNGANVGGKKHCCAQYSHRFIASASVKNLRPGHSNLQGWPISMQYPRHTP